MARNDCSARPPKPVGVSLRWWQFLILILGLSCGAGVAGSRLVQCSRAYEKQRVYHSCLAMLLRREPRIDPRKRAFTRRLAEYHERLGDDYARLVRRPWRIYTPDRPPQKPDLPDRPWREPETLDELLRMLESSSP